MAGPRTKNSTIPEGRDPLSASNYSQPQRPIDSLIPDTVNGGMSETRAEGGRRPEEKADDVLGTETGKGKVTVLLPTELLERLRNAAYWERMTLADLAEEGVRRVVENLERKNGGAYEPRAKELTKGRPPGSKNSVVKGR